MRKTAPPPIPKRIPPLRWRAPFYVWTPAAAALGVGWPALALQAQGGLVQFVMVGGLVMFAIGIVSLGAAWALGRPPRARRCVVRHILWAGVAVSLASPFVYASLVHTVAEYQNASAASGLPDKTALALLPLAILIGLPCALFSGIVFSFVALVKDDPETRIPRDQFVLRDRLREFEPFP